MSRPWIKLYTDVLGHAPTGQLSDAAFRLWIVCLLMAGQTDDEGRAGTIEDVAWSMRRTPRKARAALAELNGRIVERDGELCVRDWYDWQPLTMSTERSRRSRERATSQDNGAQRPRNVAATAPQQIDKKRVDKKRVDKKKQDPSPPDGGTWAPFYADVAALFSDTPYRKNGKLKAYVGKVVGILGPKNGDDAAAALEDWRTVVREIRREDGWERFVTTRNVHERVGKWAAKPSNATNGPAERDLARASPEDIQKTRDYLADVRKRKGIVLDD